MDSRQQILVREQLELEGGTADISNVNHTLRGQGTEISQTPRWREVDSNRWSHPHARQNAEPALMSTSFALLPRSKLIKRGNPSWLRSCLGSSDGARLAGGHRGPVNRSSALEKAFRSGGTVSSNPSSSSGESANSRSLPRSKTGVRSSSFRGPDVIHQHGTLCIRLFKGRPSM